MKKIIFSLVILFWAGILILLSFSRESQSGKNAVDIDFSEWEKLYGWDADKKAFTEKSLTGTRTEVDGLYFHRLSPIDGIYYRSRDIKPFALEKKDRTKIVKLGTGLFVCNIQTGLEKYEFRLNDIVLKPKGRGVFLMDNTDGQIKIFSFDSFLDTELANGPTQSPITRFTLFPSLLFRHDPKNTPNLKGADILRVSIVDSIRYTDMKTQADSKMLFSSNTAEKDERLLTIIQKDITDRINGFAALYSSVLKQDNKTVPGMSFFDTSNILFVNGSKKEVLLKNTLVQNIVQLLNNPLKTSYQTPVETTLSEMENTNPSVYADGLAILKQYYYVAAFPRPADTDAGISDISIQKSPLLPLAEKIIAGTKDSKQGEYYNQLSDLFSVYYFLDLKPEKLNNSFAQILQRILDSNLLTKDEFVPFVFFVTQYLSTGPSIVPNEDTMLIISYLFQIMDDYYTDNKSDATKLATITSNIFYNYTKIFTKTYNSLVHAFVDTTSQGLLLKKEFTEGENSSLEQNFVDAFVKVIKTAKEDTKAKKNAFYSKGSLQQDSWVTDSYTLLQATLGSFDTLVSMFTNYPKYLTDSHLNETNKSARGILVEKGTLMSREILEAYLKKFNNLDISSLEVTNNFQKDGFYEVQVNIMDNTFNFKLWEQNHILADISYIDPLGTKHTFPNITIPLDQKEKQLQDLLSSSDDPVIQYKHDFRNFFETTFLRGDSMVADIPMDTPTKDTSASATPEIVLFIQKELLDKDFKNIKDFFPIEFKNINASIQNGERLIELSNIVKPFLGNDSNYFTEFNGKYIFNRHSFSRLVFKVKKEGGDGWYEFDNTPIEILPPRISLLSLPDMLKDLGYYIDTIKSSYTHQQSLIIDLTGKKALLDNVPFAVKFKTE